jgi:hypothetical protein
MPNRKKVLLISSKVPFFALKFLITVYDFILSASSLFFDASVKYWFDVQALNPLSNYFACQNLFVLYLHQT